MGPGEKVGQCPLRAGVGEMPTRVAPLPTLPSHLPPVLVRVIHQHDPISRPGRRELGQHMGRMGYPLCIPTVLGPQVPCMPP